MERVYLFIQDKYFGEKSIRNIHITTAIILSIIVFYSKNIISIYGLYAIVSSDIFTLSGILAGFLFTGIGMIYTSNNKKIEEIKATNNFKLINSYFICSIVDYILVIFIYLIKNLCIPNIELLNVIGFRLQLIMLFLLFGIYLFFTATVLFLIALFILNKIISS